MPHALRSRKSRIRSSSNLTPNSPPPAAIPAPVTAPPRPATITPKDWRPEAHCTGPPATIAPAHDAALPSGSAVLPAAIPFLASSSFRSSASTRASDPRPPAAPAAEVHPGTSPGNCPSCPSGMRTSPQPWAASAVASPGRAGVAPRASPAPAAAAAATRSCWAPPMNSARSMRRNSVSSACLSEPGPKGSGGVGEGGNRDGVGPGERRRWRTGRGEEHASTGQSYPFPQRPNLILPKTHHC
eukprot:scaffold536_cov98-Isochrysis_galbana.AAC.2